MKNFTFFFYRVFSLSLVGSLTGCMEVGPNYKNPALDIPQKWTHSSTSSLSNKELAWWKNFQDPVLSKLMVESFSENLDLKQAFARIKKSEALYEKSRAAIWPTINATGTADQNKSSLNSFPGGLGPTYYRSYSLGPTTSWEIDIFGRLRRAEEAADAYLEMSLNDARGIFISLIADVAKTYISLRHAQQDLILITQKCSLLSEIYTLSQDLQKAGKISDLIPYEHKISLDQAQSEIMPLRFKIESAIHHLSILTGAPPSTLSSLLSTPFPIPSASLHVFSGLPSELLQRRPDIKHAENQLRFSTAEIGVAMGDLFPKFSLTGDFLYQSNSSQNLVSSKSSSYSIGPQFTWPIIDFGAIRANIDAKVSQRNEAFYSYKNTVLKAFEEVENALVNLSTEHMRQNVLTQALQTEKNKRDFVENKYAAGLINYMLLLQENLSTLNLMRDVQQSQALLSLNIVDLYKALGGGWEKYFPETPKP